jgi:membrane protein implicated in regulation of membrane protease activity
MLWWHWLLLGLVLTALELASAGGFYIVFFGIAAIIVSVLVFVGVGGPLWLQLLLFSALSVASLLFFRNPIMRKLNLSAGADNIDTLATETGSVIEAMAPGANGRVELRGTPWSARNVGATSLPAGARCIVVREERLTLMVKAEEALS